MAGVVRHAGRAAGARRGQRLDRGVLLESRTGFVRCSKAEDARRDDLDTEGAEHGADLAHLARLWVATTSLGRTKRRATRPGRSPVAADGQFADALLGEIEQFMNCGSENGFSSAVPWTSTMPPSPVSTKLASAWALESSG